MQSSPALFLTTPIFYHYWVACCKQDLKWVVFTFFLFRSSENGKTVQAYWYGLTWRHALCDWFGHRHHHDNLNEVSTRWQPSVRIMQRLSEDWLSWNSLWQAAKWKISEPVIMESLQYGVFKSDYCSIWKSLHLKRSKPSGLFFNRWQRQILFHVRKKHITSSLNKVARNIKLNFKMWLFFVPFFLLICYLVC